MERFTKMKKVYWLIVATFFILLASYGMLIPGLVSMASDFAVTVGLFLMFAVPAVVVTIWVKFFANFNKD